MKLLTSLKNVRRLFFRAMSEVRHDQKLKDFNIKTNNTIVSRNVNVASISGSNIVVQDGCYIDGETKIGSYTYIGFNTRITKTSIGKYCSIANNVNIGDGEHPLDKVSTSSFFIDDNFETLTKRPCIIGNDVWIGVSSIIKRNVIIGDGAIIGANSFVNKDVMPFTIVAGSPARVIRKRFSDEKIDQIISSKWWDLTPEEAKIKVAEIESGENL